MEIKSLAESGWGNLAFDRRNQTIEALKENDVCTIWMALYGVQNSIIKLQSCSKGIGRDQIDETGRIRHASNRLFLSRALSHVGDVNARNEELRTLVEPRASTGKKLRAAKSRL